jgi:pterin-4a-carbinolamine dehydratase
LYSNGLFTSPDVREKPFCFSTFYYLLKRMLKKQKVLERQQEHGWHKSPNHSLLKQRKFSDFLDSFFVNAEKNPKMLHHLRVQNNFNKLQLIYIIVQE